MMSTVGPASRWASDTTAALVLAHSWGDRRRRFVWGAPEGLRGSSRQGLLRCMSLLLARLRKRLAARIASANWGEADSNAAAR